MSTLLMINNCMNPLSKADIIMGVVNWYKLQTKEKSSTKFKKTATKLCLYFNLKNSIISQISFPYVLPRGINFVTFAVNEMYMYNAAS